MSAIYGQLGKHSSDHNFQLVSYMDVHVVTQPIDFSKKAPHAIQSMHSILCHTHTYAPNIDMYAQYTQHTWHIHDTCTPYNVILLYCIHTHAHEHNNIIMHTHTHHTRASMMVNLWSLLLIKNWLHTVNLINIKHSVCKAGSQVCWHSCFGMENNIMGKPGYKASTMCIVVNN